MFLDVALWYRGRCLRRCGNEKPSHITAVDLSEKMIEIAARKVEGDSLFEVQCRDLFEMTQETFDRIIIYNAYPHFYGERQGSTEGGRTVKSGREIYSGTWSMQGENKWLSHECAKRDYVRSVVCKRREPSMGDLF